MIVDVKIKEHRKARVWVNGQEVTSRCFHADDERGIACCFKLNARGQKYLDPKTHEAAEETLTGDVRIQMPDGGGASC